MIRFLIAATAAIALLAGLARPAEAFGRRTTVISAPGVTVVKSGILGRRTTVISAAPVRVDVHRSRVGFSYGAATHFFTPAPVFVPLAPASYRSYNLNLGVGAPLMLDTGCAPAVRGSYLRGGEGFDPVPPVCPQAPAASQQTTTTTTTTTTITNIVR